METQQATIMRCWISSVNEPLETRRDRDKLHEELRKQTIYKYFPTKKESNNRNKAKNNHKSQGQPEDVEIEELPNLSSKPPQKSKRHRKRLKSISSIEKSKCQKKRKKTVSRWSNSTPKYANLFKYGFQKIKSQKPNTKVIKQI